MNVAPEQLQDESSSQDAENQIARSRSELEGVLVDRALDPAFPRSRTMRVLHQHGPMVMAGIALGLLLVRPRWGKRVLRMLPMMRMLKRINHR